LGQVVFINYYNKFSVIFRRYSQRGLYILRPDWWLERLRSIYTPSGLVA
jgi:hypothetical protein